MKAVITKINKNKAIILKSDGTFACVPNRNYILGQEIYAIDNKRQNFTKFAKRTAAAAACLLLLLFSFGGAYAYSTPQSYVSIDINPSIELDINMFNHVIKASGVNSDGIAVLEKVEITHKSMEEAIELIITQINKEGYVGSGNEKTVIVAVHCNNHEKEKRVMENAKSQVEMSFKSLEIFTTVSINAVNEETIEEAHVMGTTAGKLYLIEDYIEISGSDEDAQSLVDTPVQEIADSINKVNSEKSQGNSAENKDKSKDEKGKSEEKKKNSDENKNNNDEKGNSSDNSQSSNKDKDK